MNIIENFIITTKIFPHHKAIMGVDLGKKNIGIAVCDPNWKIATPLTTLKRSKQKLLYGEFSKIILDYAIASVIFGLPLNMDGSKGMAVQSVQDFARDFKAHFQLPIAFWDERLSTFTMESIMQDHHVKRHKRKNSIDQLAAQCILNSAIEFLQK